MGFDEEQCPNRGPGLTHTSDDGQTCNECGALRTTLIAPSLVDWIKALRGISTPRVVKVSGEPECEDDEPPKIGDFAVLTEREWHAVIVERLYHESHQCDDR